MSTPSTSKVTTSWLLVVFLLACRAIAAVMYHPFDDAYITFRYSYNLIAGNGFVYNPGEWVLGTTAPLYALIAAFVHLVGLPLPGSMVVLNIVLDAITLLLVIRLVLPDRSTEGAVIFGALFGGSLFLGRVCAGAMEVNLFLLVGLVSIVLYHRGSRRLAVAIAAAAYYIRPEAVVLVGLLGLMELFERRWREVLVMAAIAAAVVLPGLIVIQLYYGHFLPHSVVAKSTFPNVPPTMVLRQFLYPDWMAAALLPFALWGTYLVARRPGVARTVAFWGGLHLLAYLVRRPFVWPWYGEIPAFAVVLLSSIALADLAKRVAARAGAGTVAWGTRAALAGVLLLWGYLFNKHGVSRVEESVFEPLGEWASVAMSPSTTVAAYDIGVIGYYSKANVFDLAGLVSPEMLRYRDMAEAIEKRRADYVMLVSTRETIDLMSRPRLRQMYEPERRFPGTEPATLDSTRYHARWTNDYVVFRRRDLPLGPLLSTRGGSGVGGDSITR